MEYELRGEYPLERKEFDRRMGEAEKYLFSLGVGDAAEEVGRVNATLFLAKTHFIQELLGYEQYAMVIGLPDFTFQTSPYKFRKAVPEGGKIIWGDGTCDFIPGELEPDFCGLLVGAVEDDISLEEVLDILYRMKKKDDYYIGDRKVQLENFRPGSHFLNVYKVKEYEASGLPERVAVLHTSASEWRDPLEDVVLERAEEVRTPFGISHILRGDDAREYERCCRLASDFAKMKRELLFKEIFGGGKIIANHNHYEVIGLNKAIIGCCIIKEEAEVFVITTVEGSPAHLFKGKFNLSPEKIEELGFNLRRTEEWTHDELLNANVLPHGGGHKLIDISGVAKVILYPDEKVILPRYGAGVAPTAYIDMETAFRRYRFKGIVERVQSLELADHYATLQFVYGVKVDF